jgi:hypothetical protein
VIQRLCHRCQSVLHVEDDGSLIFCWNCGAPQVTLSEELQELALAQRDAANRDEGAPESEAERAARLAAQPPDLLVAWKSVIRIAAAAAAALSVVSVLIPPLELLAWTVPAVVLAIYCSRHRETRITTAVGARIGLVCGILTSFGMTVATAAQMLALRFGLHKGYEFDNAINTTLAQVKAQVLAQSGADAAAKLNQFGIPEFRVGLFLAGLGMLTVVLLALSIAGGAFSGYMRSRAPAR